MIFRPFSVPLQKDCERTEDDFKRGSTADEMLANSLQTLGKRTLERIFVLRRKQLRHRVNKSGGCSLEARRDPHYFHRLTLWGQTKVWAV